MADEITLSRGRPSAWTPEKESLFFHALSRGLSRRRAAHYAKLPESVAFKRIAEDEDFAERCNESEACGIMLHADRVRGADELKPQTASATITAARFYLSTHDRENFAEKYQIEHTGNIGVTIADMAKEAAARIASE